MELFQAKDHYILQSGERALWCSRRDGSLQLRAGEGLGPAPGRASVPASCVGKGGPAPTHPAWLGRGATAGERGAEGKGGTLNAAEIARWRAPGEGGGARYAEGRLGKVGGRLSPLGRGDAGPPPSRGRLGAGGAACPGTAVPARNLPPPDGFFSYTKCLFLCKTQSGSPCQFPVRNPNSLSC